MATERNSTGRWLLHGIIGGIVAGLVFAMAEMILAQLMGMGAIAPLRMISSIVLGPDALAATYSTGTAIAVGLVVHMMTSAIFGLVFVGLLFAGRQQHAPTWRLLAYATVYGFALWLVNFQILGSLFWPQFKMVDQFSFGFVAHTFMYGTVLGGYLAGLAPRRTSAQIPTVEERQRRAA